MGVQWVHRAVSYCLRKVASDLKAKNAYLSKAPWLISEGLDPESAQMCVDQLRSIGSDCVCELTLWHRDVLLPYLEARCSVCYTLVSPCDRLLNGLSSP